LRRTARRATMAAVAPASRSDRPAWRSTSSPRAASFWMALVFRANLLPLSLPLRGESHVNALKSTLSLAQTRAPNNRRFTAAARLPWPPLAP
jgi:hypothetical protein